MKIARTLTVAAVLAAVTSIPARSQTAPPASSPIPDQTAETSAAQQRAVQLNPFEVTASSDNGYISSDAAAVGRIVMNLGDIPQQIDVFNAAFIHDVAPTNLQDTLRYDSAVDFDNSEFNGSSAEIRGFDTVGTGGPLVNGVRLPPGSGSDLDPIFVEALEQVEVVKGADAILYGPSQPGGMLNYVTKKPLFTAPQTTADLTFFSEGGYNGSFDATGGIPLKNQDGQDVLAFRLIGDHEDRGLYEFNDQSLQRDSLYGALTYQPTQDLTINGLWSYNHSKTEGFFNEQLLPQAEVNAIGDGIPVAQGGTATIAASQVSLPYSLYPVNWTDEDPNSYDNSHSTLVQMSAVLSHDFGRLGRWTLRAFYSFNEVALFRLLSDIPTGDNPQPVTAADIGDTVNYNEVVTAADVAAGRLWIPSRYLRELDGAPTATMDTQWDLTGRFNTGPIAHTLLIGSDQNLGTDNIGAVNGVIPAENDAENNASGAANAIWVNSPNLLSITNYNFSNVQTSLDAITGKSTTINPNGTVTQEVETLSTPANNIHYVGLPWLTIPSGGDSDEDAYFTDGMSMLNGRVLLSGGARFDELSTNTASTYYAPPVIFKDNQWTYRYGIVVKILPQLSVFGIHNESFNPNSSAADVAFGYYIPPQRGIQNEVGVRLPFLNGRLDFEASIYKIQVTNVVQTNPFGNVGVFPPVPKNAYSFVPGITDNGVDLTSRLNITKGTQLIVSYTHSNEVNAGSPAQVADGISSFPVNNQPNDQLAAWARYTPPFTGLLQGFSVRAGYRYTGRRPAGAVGALPSLYLNGYSVTDAGADYVKGRWTFSLMVRNVFNVYAFRVAPATNRLYPEEPRNATFEISVKL